MASSEKPLWMQAQEAASRHRAMVAANLSTHRASDRAQRNLNAMRALEKNADHTHFHEAWCDRAHALLFGRTLPTAHALRRGREAAAAAASRATPQAGLQPPLPLSASRSPSASPQPAHPMAAHSDLYPSDHSHHAADRSGLAGISEDGGGGFTSNSKNGRAAERIAPSTQAPEGATDNSQVAGAGEGAGEGSTPPPPIKHTATTSSPPSLSPPQQQRSLASLARRGLSEEPDSPSSDTSADMAHQPPAAATAPAATAPAATVAAAANCFASTAAVTVKLPSTGTQAAEASTQPPPPPPAAPAGATEPGAVAAYRKAYEAWWRDYSEQYGHYCAVAGAVYHQQLRQATIAAGMGHAYKQAAAAVAEAAAVTEGVERDKKKAIARHTRHRKAEEEALRSSSSSAARRGAHRRAPVVEMPPPPPVPLPAHYTRGDTGLVASPQPKTSWEDERGQGSNAPMSSSAKNKNGEVRERRSRRLGAADKARELHCEAVAMDPVEDSNDDAMIPTTPSMAVVDDDRLPLPPPPPPPPSRWPARPNSSGDANNNQSNTLAAVGMPPSHHSSATDLSGSHYYDDGRDALDVSVSDSEPEEEARAAPAPLHTDDAGKLKSKISQAHPTYYSRTKVLAAPQRTLRKATTSTTTIRTHAEQKTTTTSTSRRSAAHAAQKAPTMRF